ncbi:DUF4244 domain-containing protein [Aquihabitans sp. G128]|uniref:DUF4244 domain-containing protein n=1 Tax=Aquihabitans sp. G128 TaxID=2849779 RepID=UPI001C21A45E|nr:DUF4244 domain-containing protein [Aquihabitans sp. G128]QXC60097.1 DUF4244 domain-containing protein [Aquihabitans sp. G128]
MLSLSVTAHLALLRAAEARAHLARGRRLDRLRSASGQATAEYALVLLGAAAIALLLAAWAVKSGKVGQLFDAVFGNLISDAK